jgi:predicted MFS family arabinose efflux permease
MDTLELRLCRRLQGTLLAFFLLAALVLMVVYVAAPSLYTSTLLLRLSPAEPYPAAATLLLVGVGGFLAIVMVGVLRRWRWVFWLVLVAFGGMILDIPATILQLTGILPGLFPLWYSLCRMGASLIAVGIFVWMLQIYRRHGVWARGRKAPSGAHTRDEAAPQPKEANRCITRRRGCP